MLIKDFFDAFTAGKELSNATAWKNAQLVTAKLTVLLGAALAIAAAFGHTVPLTSEQVVTIAGAVAAVVGLFNGTATVVSTKRIGLPPKNDCELPDPADGAGHEPTDGTPVREPAAGDESPLPDMSNRA